MVKAAAGADAGEADGGAVDVSAKLASLFGVLEDALRAFALPKALHACDQILALTPADEDALRAKVSVCLHAERFEDALAVLAAHPAVAALLPFEKAYCLYRTARHGDALALLDGGAIPAAHATGAAHLRAQLQYRAGAFADCIRTYEEALQVRPWPRRLCASRASHRSALTP